MSKESFIWTDELVRELVHRTFAPGDPNHSVFEKRMEELKQQYTHQQQSNDKKEWEILNYVNYEGWEHPEGDYCVDAGCGIHSVKRLSDGEVFSVGDEVEFRSGGETDWKNCWPGKIISITTAFINKKQLDFEIYESGMESSVHKYIHNIRKLPPTPQPEQPKEKITVVGIQRMNNGVHPRSNPSQNWFKFLIMNEDISPEKYPEIKSAIEHILNDDWGYMHTTEKLREAEEKAFNAAREFKVKEYSSIIGYLAFPTFESYLNSKQ